MVPSIRIYLKRRVRLFFAIAFAGWLICAAGTLHMTGTHGCTHRCGGGPPPLLLLGMPVFFGALVGLTLLVKCPRCSGRLGGLASTTVMRGILSRPINFCPYCGVSLDEPYRKD